MKKDYEGLSIETIRSALSYLDYEDSEQWLTSGMALYSELGEEGFDLWNAWSSLGSSYDRKNIKSRWKSFRKGYGGRPVTIGTLIYHAKNAGFKFDETKKEVSPHVIQQRAERKKQLELEAQEEQKKVIQGYASAKNQAQQKWAQAKEVENHPYLTKKDVMAHNTKVGNWVWYDDNKIKHVEQNVLLIPLFKDGEIVSMQGVFTRKVIKGGKETDKFLLYSAEKQAVYHDFGELTHTILICEGWATGATLYEATQLYTLCAIDAGNLQHVAKYVRKKYPLSRIIICADNDQYKKSNTGIKYAEKASCAVDADVVYPVFASVKNKPTDFNDLYHETGDYGAVYDAVVLPTVYQAKPSDTDYFNAFDLPYIEDAKKVLDESQNALDVARGAMWYALQLSDKVPAFMTIEAIRKEIAHPLLNPRTHTSIMCRVQWSIQNRKRMATTAIRPQSWGKHEHVVVEHLSEYKPCGNPVSLVFAPMGSGKTRNVITPFSQIEGKVFGAIAHRRSLISDLAKKLQINNYDNMNASKAESSERMAICLPSIKAMQLQTFVPRIQNLAIDEISQNIRFTSSKECKVAGANQEAVFLGLKSLVRESERVIVADASIDQTTLDFMQEARPDETFTIVEQIPRKGWRDINGDWVQATRKCFLYDDRADLLTKVTIELQNGGNVWFSVESAERAEVLKQMFCDKYEVLAITSKNSKTKQIKDFLENIEVESRKYRMIIASPAISSGVSIEHDGNYHFTMIAGMASGHSICFSDFAQMLGRVRYVPHYHVCLQANNKRYEHVNASSILLGLRQAAMLEGQVIKENEYSKFKAHIEATEEMYRADFANGFVWFLQYYCFEIMRGRVVNVDYTLSEQMKALSKELKTAYRASIRNAEKISSQVAQEIESKQNTTDEEETQLIAYKIRSSLGFNLDHDIVDENIDMFENMPTLDRFARLMGYSFDIDDQENNIALRKFYNAQICAVRKIFEDMDVSSDFFGKTQCDEIIKRVSDNSNRFLLSSLKLIPSRYGQWRESKTGDLLNMGMPANTSKSVAQILDKYGLSWKRTTQGGERGYRVNIESWEKMKCYAERRYKVALN